LFVRHRARTLQNPLLLSSLLGVLLAGCTTTPTQMPVPQPMPRTSTTATELPTSLPLPLPLPKALGQPEGPGETYFDPNRTGVPLFDLRAHAKQPLGGGLVAGDFARNNNALVPYARIDARLVECLARIRATTRRKMTVLSGYRSFRHNEAIRRAGEGAAKSSFHISGKAADVVSMMPVEQFAIATYLECGCNTGLGISPRFYHIDVRTYPVTPWGYGRSQASRLAIARRVQRNVCGN